MSEYNQTFDPILVIGHWPDFMVQWFCLNTSKYLFDIWTYVFEVWIMYYQTFDLKVIQAHCDIIYGSFISSTARSA